MKKRMFLTAAVVLSMTTAMAGNKNADAKMAGYSNIYEFNVSTYSLGRTLNADRNQYEQIEFANEMLSNDMRRAGYARKAKRQERVDEAIKRNLAVMKKILDDQQYKTYLQVFNATMLNRGLK